MSHITKQAKSEFYKAENCSCIIVNDNGAVLFKSHESGISPLLKSIHLMKDACVADKIIGKAAALLCVYGGAKAVFGHIMSLQAREVLIQNGIEHDYFELTENIINRQGTDICPMEKLVESTNSPENAFKIISERLRGV